MFCHKSLAPLLAIAKSQYRSTALESCPAWVTLLMNERGMCSVPSVDEGAKAETVRLPWMPTKDLDKRKHYFKRMDHLRRVLHFTR